MANNIKKLRIAFLLTPSQFAKRIGVDVTQLNRLEMSDASPPEEWIEAVSAALGVDPKIVTDASANIEEAVTKAGAPPKPQRRFCPIGARFAIQSMVAKLGGLEMALDLSEDDLARAVQNVATFAGDEAIALDGGKRLNRLSQSLQIAVLTILQSRGVDPDDHFQRALTLARDGAIGLLQAFSAIDENCSDEEIG